jgi:Ca2+-binding EF-hand superfamily protein
VLDIIIMNKTLIIGLSALALATGGAAYAHNHGGGMKGDGPAKGPVTRAEAQTHAVAMFKKMDANNDGVLTAADREARMAERRAKAFAAMDADKNGQISRDEFMAHRQGGNDGAKKGYGMGMRGHHGGRMLAGMADADKDGRITQAEFVTAALARFDKADTNKDGTLSVEERKAMQEKMRGKWRESKRDESTK